MNSEIYKTITERVRQRLNEGDAPAASPEYVEALEDLALSFAQQPEQVPRILDQARIIEKIIIEINFDGEEAVRHAQRGDYSSANYWNAHAAGLGWALGLLRGEDPV